MRKTGEHRTVEVRKIADLPRDRFGFITGTHVVCEYHYPDDAIVYRVSVSHPHSGGSAPLFSIDVNREGRGFEPVGRMLSYPSLADCAGLRRSIRHAL